MLSQKSMNIESKNPIRNMFHNNEASHIDFKDIDNKDEEGQVAAQLEPKYEESAAEEPSLTKSASSKKVDH